MGSNFPVDLTLSADGVAYVINRGSETISNVGWNRTGVGQPVSIVTLGGQAGEEEFLGEFSRYDGDEGQIIWPAGISVDKQGDLYVTDEWLNRVSVFDKEGNLLRSWDTVQDGDNGSNGASGIAVDSNDTVFVTDSRSHKVRKFTTDGEFLGGWGQHGNSEGGLDSPWGITVDGQGCV